MEANMRKQVAFQAIKEAVESAFLPFICIIETIDNGNRIRFRVFNEKKESLLRVEVLTRRICDLKRGFPTIMQTARAKLERKGFHLLPWQSSLFVDNLNGQNN